MKSSNIAAAGRPVASAEAADEGSAGEGEVFDTGAPWAHELRVSRAVIPALITEDFKQYPRVEFQRTQRPFEVFIHCFLLGIHDALNHMLSAVHNLVLLPPNNFGVFHSSTLQFVDEGIQWILKRAEVRQIIILLKV